MHCPASKRVNSEAEAFELCAQQRRQYILNIENGAMTAFNPDLTTFFKHYCGQKLSGWTVAYREYDHRKPVCGKCRRCIEFVEMAYDGLIRYWKLDHSDEYAHMLSLTEVVKGEVPPIKLRVCWLPHVY